MLRLDNGGEYIRKYFEEFYAKEGIKRESIVPYNPQHNEVVERKNRAIVEAARAMMYDQNIPNFFWEEACFTLVYI